MSNLNENQAQPSTSSRMPSKRDFEIFRMAEILGLTHERIASVCNLTRRRVSQIVEIVRDWLSNNPCEDPQLATELQRKRLAQHMERMRLEDVITRARIALDLAPTHLTTTTIKDDGSQTKTVRQQPPIDVQVLKTYLRAIQALGTFHQEPEVPYPPPAEGEFTWAKEAMNEVLTRWYERIWSRTLKIEHFYDFGEELIGAFVKALRLQQPPAKEEREAPWDGDDESDSGGTSCQGVATAGCEILFEADNDTGDDEAPANPVGPAVPATLARSASEGNVPSISTPPGAEPAEDLNPKSKIENPKLPSREGEAPANPVGPAVPATLARSASEGKLPSIPTPHSATATSLSTEPVGWAVPTTSAEYSVPNTLGHPQAPEVSDQQNVTLSPGPLVSLSCSSASLTSQREAPSSTQSVIADEAATPSAVDSCGVKASTEIDPSSASPSQENPKREAPPPSPATGHWPPAADSCPPVPLSPSPLVSPALPTAPDGFSPSG